VQLSLPDNSITQTCDVGDGATLNAYDYMSWATKYAFKRTVGGKFLKFVNTPATLYNII